MNDDIKAFRFQIIKYTFVVTLIIEVCSIPVIGFSVPFLCGLLVGTAVATVSFLLLIFVSKRVLATGEKWMASAGYMIRLPIYGVAFYLTLKMGGTVAGINAFSVWYLVLTVAVIASCLVCSYVFYKRRDYKI